MTGLVSTAAAGALQTALPPILNAVWAGALYAGGLLALNAFNDIKVTFAFDSSTPPQRHDLETNIPEGDVVEMVANRLANEYAKDIIRRFDLFGTYGPIPSEITMKFNGKNPFDTDNVDRIIKEFKQNISDIIKSDPGFEESLGLDNCPITRGDDAYADLKVGEFHKKQIQPDINAVISPDSKLDYNGKYPKILELTQGLIKTVDSMRDVIEETVKGYTQASVIEGAKADKAIETQQAKEASHN